jgi:hypothetical protein
MMPRDEVDMEMTNALPGCDTFIDSYCIAIGAIFG